jgi:hypothetical protein
VFPMLKVPSGMLTVPLAARFWQVSKPVTVGLLLEAAPIWSAVTRGATLGCIPLAGLVALE